MRSRSSILELIVQFLFPFQCFRLKRNVDNNNINQSLLPWRLWNKTLFMGLPPDCTFEGSKIVSRYLSQNKSLLWPSFSICFEIQAVQCTAGLPRSPESVEKEIKLHCKVTNIRSTRTNVEQAYKEYSSLWVKSAQLTVQRRPNIPKISSFSDCLRHEDGLWTLSDLVPDMISRISIFVRSLILAVAEPPFENRPGSRILCSVPALRHAEVRRRGTLIPRSPLTQLITQGRELPHITDRNARCSL